MKHSVHDFECTNRKDSLALIERKFTARQVRQVGLSFAGATEQVEKREAKTTRQEKKIYT